MVSENILAQVETRKDGRARPQVPAGLRRVGGGEGLCRGRAMKLQLTVLYQGPPCLAGRHLPSALTLSKAWEDAGTQRGW